MVSYYFPNPIMDSWYYVAEDFFLDINITCPQNLTQDKIIYKTIDSFGIKVQDDVNTKAILEGYIP